MRTQTQTQTQTEPLPVVSAAWVEPAPVGFASVNLLPPEIAEARRRRRRAIICAAAVLAWALVLGGLYLLKLGAVADARADRDAAQTEVVRLQGDVTSLERFARLDERRQARSDLLATAMAEQLAWARILYDLGQAFPRDAALLTLNAVGTSASAATDPAATAVPAPAGATAVPGSTPGAVASVDFTGYSVKRFSPGVETTLMDLNDVASFFEPYLSTAAEEERGGKEVTNFTGRVQIDEGGYTRRYAEGLPARVAP